MCQVTRNIVLAYLFIHISPLVFSQGSQTIYYERIEIVKDGKHIADVGDGHYITFNEKGCYDSDKDGFTEKTGFRAYERLDNGITSYYGDSYFGKARYLFNSSKSRMNIIIDKTKEVYVYVKKDNYDATYSRQSKRSSSATGNSIGVSPVIIVPAPPVIYGDGGGQGNTSGRQRCRACNGTGKGGEQIVYAPNYTGKDNSRYCAQCGHTSSAHTHIRHSCATCNGRGYVSF